MARIARAVRLVLLPALVALLAAACTAAPAATPALAAAQAQVRDAIAAPVALAQGAAAQALVPTAIDARAAVQSVLPAAAPPPVEISAEAVALIIRWEIGSPAQYTRRYTGVECPGLASGPTIGIGYDLGQNTAADIARDWATHPDVAALQTAAGITGDAACKQWRAAHPGLRTPYPLAEQVFRTATLPRYHAAARRALAHGWPALPLPAQGADVSMGYNRGWAMVGQRNREKRALRDDCTPAGDARCTAAQLRAMKRLWPGVRGLRDRREDEARLAESS